MGLDGSMFRIVIVQGNDGWCMNKTIHTKYLHMGVLNGPMDVLMTTFIILERMLIRLGESTTKNVHGIF